jgi:hypothetical protein
MSPGKHNINRFFKRLDLKLGKVKGEAPISIDQLREGLPKIPGARLEMPSESMKQRPINIDRSRFPPPVNPVYLGDRRAIPTFLVDRMRKKY